MPVADLAAFGVAPALMSVERKTFWILMFLDRELYGYDENTLPMLIGLMDSAAPDHRSWTHTGPTGYFLTSPEARDRIIQVIDRAELLRASDARFEHLGIGFAEGLMVAEFSSSGDLEADRSPLGSAAGEAYRCAEIDGYCSALRALQ